MTSLTRRDMLWAGAASGVTLSLSGCLQIPPPPPEIPPLSYTAQRDGSHTIPAVPIQEIPAFLHRQVVPFETTEIPGAIVIQNQNRLLHLILPDGYALRYGISVGREGFGWTGDSTIYRTAHWPTWTPPPEMIRREPHLERWKDGQPGGPNNPLGARALYLLTDGRDQGYRIHGTPEWRSIGRFASSGCFRMLHHDVIDLHRRVRVRARVVVV